MPRNLITSPEVIKKAAKAAAGKRARVSDGDGLYLLLNADGGSHGWRFDYTFAAKRKTISLGTYPDVSMAVARRKADAARAHLADGLNPSDLRKAERAEHRAASEVAAQAKARAANGEAPLNSVRDLAQRYRAHKTSPDKRGVAEWSAAYAKKFDQRMARWVYPYLGDRPIAAVTWREVLEVLKRPEAEGKREMAHTLRGYCDQVWDHALVSRVVEVNAVKSIDSRRMLLPAIKKNMSAIIEPARLTDLVLGIDVYNGSIVTRTALLMSLLTFQRPGNIQRAEWTEIDLDGATWTIPTSKMKGTAEQKLNGRDHVVPLARQLVKALRELYPLTGRRAYVFPSERGNGRPMSENTVNTALRAMGFSGDEMVGHGFRATARTILAERVKIDGQPVNEAWIEAQLAHEKSGPLGAAYDRAKYLEQRVILMQAWADYVDGLRADAPALRIRVKDEVAA